MMRSASSNMVRQKHPSPKVRDAMPSATAASPGEGRGADMVRQAQVRVESSGDLYEFRIGNIEHPKCPCVECHRRRS